MAGVNVAIALGERAFTIELVALEVTGVGVAIGKSQDAIPFFFTVDPIAFVASAIRPLQLAAAVELFLKKSAFIRGAVRRPVGALTGNHSVAPGAITKLHLCQLFQRGVRSEERRVG